MIARCYRPSCSSYVDYGGRGITVCEKWKKFTGFLEDMGIRPEGMSIDRWNSDGNYELDNCRWATRKEQQNNQRRTRKRGGLTLAEYAAKHGVCPDTVLARERLGITPDRYRIKEAA